MLLATDMITFKQMTPSAISTWNHKQIVSATGISRSFLISTLWGAVVSQSSCRLKTFPHLSVKWKGTLPPGELAPWNMGFNEYIAVLQSPGPVMPATHLTQRDSPATAEKAEAISRLSLKSALQGKDTRLSRVTFRTIVFAKKVVKEGSESWDNLEAKLVNTMV